MPGSNIPDVIERLVARFESRLASLSLDTDDLRQELYIIYMTCQKNYDPERGDFDSFFSVTARNRLYGYFRDKQPRLNTVPLPSNVVCEAKENVEDYLPLYNGLRPVEFEIIMDYLEGYTFAEIEERCGLESNTGKHRLDEIIIKIQEANEQNKNSRF